MNQRIIKFRVWDEEKKEMELLNSLYELQRMNKTIKELDKLVFLQFTGLLDKNGKEIFEGDIVKRNNKDFGIIEYNKRNAKFSFNDLGNTLSYWDNLEIIGNVFENPNLIK